MHARYIVCEILKARCAAADERRGARRAHTKGRGISRAWRAIRERERSSLSRFYHRLAGLLLLDRQ